MMIKPHPPVRLPVRQERASLHGAPNEPACEALARAWDREQIGARLAHELKNLLTGVKALVQLGLRNPAEAASHPRLAMIEGEVTRMEEILQSFLSLARSLEEVASVRVDVGPLVSETLLMLSARAEDGRVRLRAKGDATLEGDPRRLREALRNLVANAIEATPPGGEVVVEVGQAGEETEIVIHDSGCGMPPETLRRLGTPFFTTREDGTGLGVMLARGVVAQHGGTLRYESVPGKGTTVRATLPRRAAPGASAATPA
ncbi:MAG TPA: HAMP domain-containing sensor histidine kinase [Anaeromyxobacteraceae bacterium]|nr:HAMP domain-containing sensor histidine kinase [Anaeromyxobacteraceae bacterium]